MVQETFLVVPIKSLFLCEKMPPCKPTLIASPSIKQRFKDSYSGTSHDQVFFMSFPTASQCYPPLLSIGHKNSHERGLNGVGNPSVVVYTASVLKDEVRYQLVAALRGYTNPTCVLCGHQNTTHYIINRLHSLNYTAITYVWPKTSPNILV